MKKLLYLPIFALLLFACDKDDDCHCNAEFQDLEMMGSFFKDNVELDCNTQKPTQKELDEISKTHRSFVFVKCR